jgi:hypothetical protein
MPSDRIDPIEPVLPGAVARVGSIVLTPAQREEERRRREAARDERRRREATGPAAAAEPSADAGERPHVDVRG